MSIQYKKPSNLIELKELLDEVVDGVNSTGFIPFDPISIPHRFKLKQDIEIAAFFAATFAWGNRKTIIQKCTELLNLMDNAPYEFIISHTENDRKRLIGFTHRTFQSTDTLYFVKTLQNHYQQHESLESAFLSKSHGYEQKNALINFHRYFFDDGFAPTRTKKHVSTPENNSACKRLNLFLKWMVRKDDKGVDFGIWDSIPMSGLMIPLDIHVSRISEQLGLHSRKQKDWKMVEEITSNLRKINPNDPVIYDYALFGLGAGLY